MLILTASCPLLCLPKTFIHSPNNFFSPGIQMLQPASRISTIFPRWKRHSCIWSISSITMEPSSVRYRICCHNLQRAFCKDRKKVPKTEKSITFYCILLSKFGHKESQSKLLKCAFLPFGRYEGVLGVKACLHASLTWTLYGEELHVTSALLPVEEPLVTPDYQVGRFQSPSGHFGKEKNPFLLMGIEPRSLVTILRLN
jgi:hypothetical protein